MSFADNYFGNLQVIKGLKLQEYKIICLYHFYCAGLSPFLTCDFQHL